MGRDVEIDIIANDKTSRGTRSARKNFDDLEKDTNRFVKGFAGLGESIASKFGSNISKAVSAAGPQVQAAIAGVIVVGAVAAAPLIGAAISGAIIGGIGIGGVVGGFVLASKDERVQAAFASMKTDIGDQLKDASTPFVATSIRGITQIGNAVKKIDFKQIFADSAKNAAPLIDGITRAVTELGSAIGNVIHNSAPVVTEIGNEIGAFSHVIAQGLNSISDNGKQGADALHELFVIINGTVGVTFQFVNALTEVYGILNKITGGGPVQFLDEFAAASANVANKAGDMAQGSIDAAIATNQFGTAAGIAAGPIQTFTDKVNAATSSTHSLYDANTSVGAALDNARTAAEKNGKTLSENTQKGRENRTALSNLAGAMVAQYNASVQVNGEGIKSNKVAADNRAAFIKLATQLGLSKTAAAALATQMGLIPAKKNTDFHANTHDAEARIKALEDQLKAIKNKTVTVSVDYAYTTFNKPATAISPYDYRGHSASMFAGVSSGTHRTGGPNQIQSPAITNDVAVYVNGVLTSSEMRESRRESRFQSTVGRRYAYGR